MRCAYAGQSIDQFNDPEKTQYSSSMNYTAKKNLALPCRGANSAGKRSEPEALALRKKKSSG